MFDVKKKEKVKWFVFEDDESYKLKFMNEDNRLEYQSLYNEYESLSNKKKTKETLLQIEEKLNKFSAIILSHVLEWKGIVSDGKPLECNTTNKELVFTQSDYWSTERFKFVIAKIVNPQEFFNIGDYLKN